RERRIPVHSYAVGPEFDLRVLGTLALQTGGVVLFDNSEGAVAGGAATEGQANPSDKGTAQARRFAQRQREAQSPASVGRRLAAAAVAPVFYPERISVSEGLSLLPKVALPLRADRSTIYVGKGDFAGE